MLFCAWQLSGFENPFSAVLFLHIPPLLWSMAMVWKRQFSIFLVFHSFCFCSAVSACKTCITHDYCAMLSSAWQSSRRPTICHIFLLLFSTCLSSFHPVSAVFHLNLYFGLFLASKCINSVAENSLLVARKVLLTGSFGIDTLPKKFTCQKKETQKENTTNVEKKTSSQAR